MNRGRSIAAASAIVAAALWILCRPAVAAAQVSKAEQAHIAAKLTLDQGRSETVATRVSAGEAARSAEELVAKVKAQTQDPLSEAALRRFLDEQASSRPNCDRMSPLLAAAVRQQLPVNAAYLIALGPIKSIAFQGVTPTGADIYEVLFSGGRKLEARIMVAADGLVEGFRYRELPS